MLRGRWCDDGVHEVIVVVEGTAVAWAYEGSEEAAASWECVRAAGCLAEGTRHTLGQ